MSSLPSIRMWSRSSCGRSTIIREMRVKLILERGLNGVRVSCPSLTFDGEVIDDSRERERALARRLFDILGGQKLLYAAREVPRFSLIDERRGRKTILKASPEAIVPQDLELTLFDAMTSAEPLLYSRWALLADMIIEAMPGLSPGRFVAAYDRVASAATLFYESSKGRLPIRQMGSSVQQIAALLGHALMSGASLIAIEEPESNLKYPLQVRLRDVFRKLVAHPYGPRQLFITSHSPAFETGDHFYAMTLDNGIPRLTRRPVAEAPAFTGLDNLPVPPSGEGRRSYVTSDGLVEVPPFVLDALGLPQGGGVFFAVRKDDGHVEMLSHRQFLELGGYPTRDDDTDD
ncbi:MAG: AAA family ATPase [bacterium]